MCAVKRCGGDPGPGVLFVNALEPCRPHACLCIYVPAVHAAVPRLFAELQFIADYAPPELMLSRPGFVLTNLMVRKGGL